MELPGSELLVLPVRAKDLVPPGEGGSVVAIEVEVVEVMEFGTGIERDEMENVEPGYVVAAVHVNRFKQAHSNPHPQEEHMVAQQHNANEETESKDQSFSRMGILRCHAKWSLEVMVNLVDKLVDATIMERKVQKIVPCVLNDSTTECTQSQVPPRWHVIPVIRDVEELGEGVRSYNQWGLDNKMVEHKQPEAFPLLICCFRFVPLNFVFSREGKELE